MSELTFALIAAAIFFALGLAAMLILRSVYLQPTFSERDKAVLGMWAHFLWWACVFPFWFTGLAFPVVAVADLIWKFTK